MRDYFRRRRPRSWTCSNSTIRSWHGGSCAIPKELQDEYEADAEILPTVLLGMPLQVRPEMEPGPRLRCLVDFIKSRAMLGEPATPLQLRSVQMRMQALFAAAAAKNPKEARMMQQAIGEEIKATMQQVQPAPGPVGDPAEMAANRDCRSHGGRLGSAA